MQKLVGERGHPYFFRSNARLDLELLNRRSGGSSGDVITTALST
jgi:hypothetical protein